MFSSYIVEFVFDNVWAGTGYLLPTEVQWCLLWWQITIRPPLISGQTGGIPEAATDVTKFPWKGCVSFIIMISGSRLPVYIVLVQCVDTELSLTGWDILWRNNCALLPAQIEKLITSYYRNIFNIHFQKSHFWAIQVNCRIFVYHYSRTLDTVTTWTVFVFIGWFAQT